MCELSHTGHWISKLNPTKIEKQVARARRDESFKNLDS